MRKLKYWTWAEGAFSIAPSKLLYMLSQVGLHTTNSRLSRQQEGREKGSAACKALILILWKPTCMWVPNSGRRSTVQAKTSFYFLDGQPLIKYASRMGENEAKDIIILLLGCVMMEQMTSPIWRACIMHISSMQWLAYLLLVGYFDSLLLMIGAEND